MKSKRGQAAAAATLIAVIAGMIVLYIIFLQPDDRAELLGEDIRFSGTGLRSSGKNATLLNETPGRVDFLSQKKVEHSIPTVHLFTHTKGVVIEQRPSLQVSRSLFSSSDASMSFHIGDIANTENVLLSFNVQEFKGQLTITLNEQVIFQGDLANIAPISIPIRLLKQENSLLFQASSPGAAFWRTNGATLQDVKVTADVTDTDATRSRSVFLISNTEYNNLEKVFLKFQPDCNINTASPLDIFVNEFNVYSGVPDCGVQRMKLEFPVSYVRRGENEISLSIERGDYIVAQLAVEAELKEVDFPVYYFDVSEEQFRGIQNDSKDVIIRLDFVDSIDRKQGQLIVNGHINGFDSKDVFLEKEVSRDIERGNNAIKIKPERTLDIRKITVILAAR
ncbi:hypothetical protein J4207_02440 [Candidatus Woesearchaeota archaeon]|nr:hypothetical protein [Candidatus Woesearchaeota archaeon]